MNLTAKELADEINGIEYDRNFSNRMREYAEIAKISGLVICYGQSDDLLEFDGAISDEVGAWNGTTALIDSDGVIPSYEAASEDEEECASYFKRKPNGRSVEAVWDEEGSGYAWIIKTDIPHEIFSIMEEGEGFSRGIVFAMSDISRGEA